MIQTFSKYDVNLLPEHFLSDWLDFRADYFKVSPKMNFKIFAAYIFFLYLNPKTVKGCIKIWINVEKPLNRMLRSYLLILKLSLRLELHSLARILLTIYLRHRSEQTDQKSVIFANKSSSGGGRDDQGFVWTSSPFTRLIESLLWHFFGFNKKNHLMLEQVVGLKSENQTHIGALDLVLLPALSTMRIRYG